MNSKKIKILYFTTCLDVGGTEIQLFNLLSVLSKEDIYEIILISLAGGVLKKKFENLGINVIVFKDRISYFDFFKMLSFFRYNVREFKPDIVHSCLSHANIVSKCSLFFLKKNFKLICSYRNLIQKYFLIKNLEYINMRKVDMLISNSRAADTDLNIYNIEKTKRKIVYNSFNKKKIDNATAQNLKKLYAKNKKIVLTVANFRDGKDYETNLLCCNELVKKRQDMIFLYIGAPGEESEKVSELIKRLKLSKYVKVLGRRNDVLEFMKISDVFFMPTLFESQSNSVMEAMYMKLPLVITDIPANRELAKEAFFCNVKDYKAMSKTIDLVLSNKHNMEWQKMNFQVLESKFSIDTMCESYRKIYKHLLSHN